MSDDASTSEWLDEQAQNNPAWQEWARPERIAAQVDRLFAATLPAVPGVPPMPEADRYSDTMLNWVADAFEHLLPDGDALTEPDNADLADQFVCYIGETLRQRAGGEWFNESFQDGSVLYGMRFTPAIGYRHGASPDDITDWLFRAVEADDGPDFFLEIGTEIYSRAIAYADAHGLPHDLREVREQHGLA
ncbi:MULTISPECIES: hypothetical protein [unclassified Nocardia]|uniref:hypothetical protein n=1 Tax=unclassified Nocardia TaxID=2637762 RepID=UPI0024A810B8|nr:MULTISPECIES: hypothetical protein [unclassified Nocardia]